MRFVLLTRLRYFKALRPGCQFGVLYWVVWWLAKRTFRISYCRPNHRDRRVHVERPQCFFLLLHGSWRDQFWLLGGRGDRFNNNNKLWLWLPNHRGWSNNRQVPCYPSIHQEDTQLEKRPARNSVQPHVSSTHTNNDCFHLGHLKCQEFPLRE